PDWPLAGVQFRDITPLLQDPLVFRVLIDAFVHRYMAPSHRPDVVAVERVFFQVNVRTAMAVGQASGIALSEAWSSGCEVVQYTPNEVKQTVAGHGSADKAQVGRMVMMRLGLNAVPKPADAADAAALALCHLAVAPTRRALQRARASR
ncbi:MAG: crossover junction endodeoxyribonuclease RuvC, partial [Ilumatobacter sp.]